MRIDHPAAGCGLTKTTSEGRYMIARNYRRFPDALQLQLEFNFRTRRPQRRPHQKPAISAPLTRLRYLPPPRPMDAEQVPIGSLIRTPSGKEARVIGYRGFKRDIRVRLVCRYTEPENKRFDVVLLAPELVVVLVEGEKR